MRNVASCCWRRRHIRQQAAVLLDGMGVIRCRCVVSACTLVAYLFVCAFADFSIDEQDNTGHSALHYACGYGETEIVKLLLENKASVTCVDDDKNTPLHYAAGYGQLDSVKELLQQCAASLFCLVFVVSCARCKSHVGCAELWQDVCRCVCGVSAASWLRFARACSGAGLTDKNKDGKTALEVAQLNEHPDIVTLLKEQESGAFL